MDEVLTGFRVSSAGWYGLDGVGAAILVHVSASVMGGGLPCAAFGGRAEIMQRLAPVGPVYQAGTLSGNPLATAAGLATLRACTPAVLRRGRLVRRGAASKLVSAELAAAGVPHYLSTAGSLFTVFIGRDSTRWPTTTTPRTSPPPRTAAFFHAMLARGVYLPPSAFEAWFTLRGPLASAWALSPRIAARPAHGAARGAKALSRLRTEAELRAWRPLSPRPHLSNSRAVPANRPGLAGSQRRAGRSPAPGPAASSPVRRPVATACCASPRPVSAVDDQDVAACLPVDRQHFHVGYLPSCDRRGRGARSRAWSARRRPARGHRYRG